MALRSSISSLSTSSAPRTSPLDNLQREPEEEISVEEVSTPPLTRRTGAAQPASEQPPVSASTTGRGRGRPRKALGSITTAPVTEKPARKTRAPKAALPGSPAELRAALKATEAELLVLKEAVAAATARFQPKIDRLFTKHAELSAQLSAALLK